MNSWEGIKKLPLRYSLSVGIAAELYQRIGIKIIKNNCNVWDQRIHLILIEKIFYSLVAIKKIFFRTKKVNKNIDVDCNLFLKKFKIM